MTKRVRPPFVLCFAGDMAGCGYHRMAVPLMTMVVAGHAEGRIDLSLWPVEMIVAVRPDTIVFQRYLEDGQIAVMEQIKEALPDTLLVYELDDYLGEIPKASFHAGFMPPDLPMKIARAASVCHRVTTSTESLAEWFRTDLGQADVRVVANAIPGAAVRPRAARTEGRLRIGFVGGISHDGDLEIIRPAMKAIGEAVEWVFFGAQPKDPPVRTEFHPGVQPGEYQMKMLSLDLDLVLAPLEDNKFNHCKSNLRLIETGMIGACAIAQKLTPYTEGDPPVFAYAETPDEWTAAIQAFIDTPMIGRQLSADALQRWVTETHTLEKRLPERLDGWLSTKWQRADARPRAEDAFVALAEGKPPHYFRHAVKRLTLIDACAAAKASGADVLWLRTGAVLDETGWRAMQGALVQTDNVSSVVPLASDGPNAFPRLQNWTPMPAATTHAMALALHRDMPGRRLIVGAPSGPAILLGARALAMLGFPDVEGCDGNEEQAIMEWGLRAAQRGWRNMQAADAYASSLVPPTPPTHRAGQRLQLRGYAQGGFAGENLSPHERADAEMTFLRLQWAGPQPGTAGFGFDYASWAALKGDLPAPTRHTPLELSIEKVDFGDTVDDDVHWLVFTGEGFAWKPNGYAALREALVGLPVSVGVAYGDNEFRNSEGGIYPDLKPDFDLELFLARDYVTPVCAVRRTLLGREMPANRAELYGVLLAHAEEAGARAFQHVSRMLAVLPEESPEEMAMSALSRQMQIESVYGDAVSVKANPNLPGCLSVVRQWDVNKHNKRTLGAACPARISIIIPTLGHGRLIQPCVNTIRQHTNYPDFEIVVVQNGPLAEPELGEAKNDPRVRVVRWVPAESEKFSWSAINNWAVQHVRSHYLLFMNDDVMVGAPDWLDAMMGHAVREDVGAVGARLLHPAGFIQHIGVICHKGIAGHLCKGLPNGQPGNGWLAALTHEAQAVTAACMLVSRKHFDDAGGFDEKTFPMNYSDTDFCLKLRKAGLRNIVEMTAELLHPEGTSRNDPASQAATVRQLQIDNANFAARWPQDDPYWHPDLSLGISQGGLSINGLNRELLLWPERLPAEGASRTLLINDIPGLGGQIVARSRRGEIVFAADLSGFALRLIAPLPANLPGWDMRSGATALREDLQRLGIDRIVLRSLVGMQGAAAPVESLRCLESLGIPVEIESIHAAVMTPWLIEASGPGPFGSADMTAWRTAYEALTQTTREAAE